MTTKESCFAGAIEPAPDAGVWTFVQGDGFPQLVRLDADGAQARAYDINHGQQEAYTVQSRSASKLGEVSLADGGLAFVVPKRTATGGLRAL